MHMLRHQNVLFYLFVSFTSIILHPREFIEGSVFYFLPRFALCLLLLSSPHSKAHSPSRLSGTEKEKQKGKSKMRMGKNERLVEPVQGYCSTQVERQEPLL